MHTPELLYQQFKQKTRVVVCGNPESLAISKLLLEISDYHEKAFNYFLGNEHKESLSLSKASDFVIFWGDDTPKTSLATTNAKNFSQYRANISLITGIDLSEKTGFASKEIAENTYKEFIANITPGGILIYNQEDATLKELVEAHPNPIRKIPYQTSSYQTNSEGILLETEDGPMPAEISNTKLADQLTGLQYLCQAVGIGTEDFLEALANTTDNSLNSHTL